MFKEISAAVLLPFLGTVIGSGLVLFMRGAMNRRLQRILTGFAAGVMVAASIWSLIIPAIDQSEHMGKLAFLPAFIGVWGGVLFLLGIRGMYLALPVMILAMPLGLNLVVFPESMGIDASSNAKMCFVCNLLTICVLPFVFALLSQIM